MEGYGTSSFSAAKLSYNILGIVSANQDRELAPTHTPVTGAGCYVVAGSSAIKELNCGSSIKPFISLREGSLPDFSLDHTGSSEKQEREVRGRERGGEREGREEEMGERGRLLTNL